MPHFTDFLTVQEAAESLGVTARRVRQYVDKRRLPGKKLGNLIIIPRKAVSEFGKQPRRPGRPKASA